MFPQFPLPVPIVEAAGDGVEEPVHEEEVDVHGVDDEHDEGELGGH